LLSFVVANACVAPTAAEPPSTAALRLEDDQFTQPHADPTYEGYRFRDSCRVHFYIAILVERTEHGALVRAWTEIDGAHAPRTVAETDWQDLRRAIDDSGFWSMPTDEVDQPRGRDGCAWLIEGVRGTQRRTIVRHDALERADARHLAGLAAFARRLLERAHVNPEWLH
jgi:hypothetical protein